MNVNHLSLEEKIGQMFMCGFVGTQPNSNIVNLIEKSHIGGIIYFRRNVSYPQQIQDLSNNLQQIAKNSRSQIPLFIAIDQEGGMVARIDKNITLIPGQMALGATRDVNGAYKAAKISGKELRLMGINMNFSPSIDVNNNRNNPVIGVRSFGEDPYLVKEMGVATIKGLQENKISATVKHFPGHGDTSIDSHYALPIIKHDLKRLHEVELIPFIGAIEAGVDAIMSAHILFPAIDPTNTPATLSQPVLTRLLREQLKFEGLIVTDCLEMNAISDGFGTEAGALKAVEAGADILLVSHSYEKQQGAIKELFNAVKKGRISEDRINQSVERIIELKNKRLMGEIIKEKIISNKNICRMEDLNYIKSLSEKSITLVKDNGQLPIRNKKTYVIWPKVKVSSEVDEIIEQETLGDILSQHIDNVYEDVIGVNPTMKEIDEVIQKSEQFEQVIFVGYNASFSEGQQTIIRAIAKKEDITFILVAARNPYDIAEFPEVKTYIACYENRPLAIESLTKLMLGNIRPQGKLPVSISHEYPYHWSYDS